jgi:hypothetical protein
VFSGAPGAGKTAVLGAVRDRLRATVAIDMDAFLEPGSALAGADLRYAAASWPAYTALCVRLVGTVVESGADCLLLTPLEPREVPAWPPGDVAWAVLDCPDGVRRQRLARRGMGEPEIRHAIEDAAWSRRLGLPLISSSGTLDETADRITDWISRARC